MAFMPLPPNKGDNACVVIANPTDGDAKLELQASGVITKCLITCEGKNAEEIPMPEVLPKNSFLTVCYELNRL